MVQGKFTLFLALLGLAIQFCVGTAVVVDYGVETDVTANTETVLVLGASGATEATSVTLTIETTADAKVTLKQSTSVGAELPRGYNSISVTGGTQYELIVTAATGSDAVGLTTATLSAPDVGATIAALVNLEVGCVRFDSETNAYTAVDDVTVTGTVTKRVEVELPQAGIYVIASYAQTVPLPTLYAEVRVTSNTEAKSFQYANELEITVKTTSDNNELTVSKKAAADASAAFEASTKVAGKAAVVAGGVFDIALKSEEEVEAEIEFRLSAETAADIDVSSIIVAFYNTTAKAWTQATGKLTVDAEARVVTQASTHFSEWAMFADGKDGGSDSGAATHAGSVVSVGALVGTMLYLL